MVIDLCANFELELKKDMTYKASRHDYQIGEQKDKIAQIEILCDEVIKKKDNNFIADEIETLKLEASNTVDLITVNTFFS